ncbi:helix-turn-helix domain-containing protein [Xenorhabdus cabanillasii]|uniref:helix-turn-helix domain-containing protein n=1 Tax=Xenorhabdus cabanillasii TaxID=351673 RepID=UPI002B40083D|nr:helix-turn-helix transcriptional regulator [Xenorhabdus sp. Flor]
MMRKNGENKSSLAMRSGVTRTTLYKILDGQINRVQHSTITRIADFFGVRCDVIEHCDLEELDRIDNTLSIEGNKNPSAIPLIPQSDVLSSMDARIGQLIMKYPVIWAFEEGANLIGLTVESEIDKIFFPGDTLIIKRYATPGEHQPSLIYAPERGFYLHDLSDGVKKDLAINEKLIGTIIEERIS